MYKENDNLNTAEIERLVKMDPDELEKLMLEKEAEAIEKIKGKNNK